MRPFLKLPRKVGLPIGVKPLKGVAMGHEHTSVIFFDRFFLSLGPSKMLVRSRPDHPQWGL